MRLKDSHTLLANMLDFWGILHGALSNSSFSFSSSLFLKITLPLVCLLSYCPYLHTVSSVPFCILSYFLVAFYFSFPILFYCFTPCISCSSYLSYVPSHLLPPLAPFFSPSVFSFPRIMNFLHPSPSVNIFDQF